MEPMKNLCGLIPESLHKRLMEGKSPEMTNGEYLTKILTTYLDQPATGTAPECGPSGQQERTDAGHCYARISFPPR